MLEQQFLFPALESLAFVGGGDGSMVLDHEIVFVSRRSSNIKEKSPFTNLILG